jgi:Protein of unknown function (DUF4242)
MPTFIDFHSMGAFTEDDLKKSQKEPRDEFGVKVLNIFYDMGSGMIFCLIDAPDRFTVERHHSKLGVKCDWITPVKMTSEYDSLE